jgi:hypothetical protein
MTSILYDFSPQISKQDRALQEIDGTADSFVRAAAGTSLVEFFPWMMFIPQRYKNFPTIQRRPLHLMKQQVCEVEKGSFGTIC